MNSSRREISAPPPSPKQTFSAPKLTMPASPKLPTAWPPIAAPSACAASSMTRMFRPRNQLDDAVNLSGIAKKMRHNDRFGFLRQRSFNGFDGEIEFFADIGEHWRRAKRQNRRHHGRAAKRRQDDFIAAAHAASAERDLQSQTAGTAEQRSGDAECFNDLRFECSEFGTVDDAARDQAVKNALIGFAIPERNSKRNTGKDERFNGQATSRRGFQPRPDNSEYFLRSFFRESSPRIAVNFSRRPRRHVRIDVVSTERAIFLTNPHIRSG